MADFSKFPQRAGSASANGEQAFDVELDEYDLLEPEPESGQQSEQSSKLLGETDLTQTARAFNTRMQRKKREQEEALGQQEKEARKRYGLMIQAMMNIRKSLREVRRIDLGERFQFCLVADDWFGWPRLTIKLEDAELPDAEYAQLSVTAHDRQQSATIEFICGDGVPPERISLAREGGYKRLPNILRKCVRNYLDQVGDIVLEAENREEDGGTDRYIENKDISEFADNESQETESALGGDFFEEDYGEDNLLEALPTLDDVESLPDLSPESQRHSESDFEKK